LSERNVDQLRAGFQAFATGDIDAVMDLFDDDVEWSPAIAPLLGVETIRGKEALRRFFVRDLFDGFDEFRAEPLSIEDFGDYALVTTRYTGRGERSGIEMDQTYSSVYEIREGKTVWFRDYETREQALEAIGATVEDEAGRPTSPRT
jgi:ketosteroid isomerase-like protein